MDLFLVGCPDIVLSKVAVIFIFGISGKLCLPLKLNELQKLKTSIYCCDVHDKAVSLPYQELTAEEFLLHCRHQIY